MTAGWDVFDAELAHWRDAGRAPPVWWRDDDAIEPSAALDRLLALAGAFGVPLTLAVVPAAAGGPLAGRLAGEPDGVRVVQHGYAHQNHAPAGMPRMELGTHRPAMIVVGELGTGWLALERLFGTRTLPVLVPPWNRIDPVLVPMLPEIGFRGLSTFGARRRREPVTGLLQVNTHVDLVDWRGSRGFVGEERALAGLTDGLRQRRLEKSDPRGGTAEPIGLLSHHLVMDEPGWGFLARLFDRLKSAGLLTILPADQVFAGRPAIGRRLSQ
jgi:hypothetical protein